MIKLVGATIGPLSHYHVGGPDTQDGFTCSCILLNVNIIKCKLLLFDILKGIILLLLIIKELSNACWRTRYTGMDLLAAA